MPNRQKISVEEKVEYVRAYLRGEITQGCISKAVGVSLASVQMWIKRYEAEGADGFYTHKGNRSYAPKTKTMAVLDYLNGKASQLDICRKYKIRSKYQLQSWIKVYNAHGDFNSRKHSGGGSYMSKARSTTQEERLQLTFTSVILCVRLKHTFIITTTNIPSLP
ncbi:Transposase and inactivated derivatives [Selenomonas ruminantium]|uniref:Transposase and inactivated derivatives n=1 Tax=Selenomonas ruminantium TaxID=971 RepID=A0A1M6WAY9_SELRU|nr:helix-turn-helix domain-containing protein [Selenomonas ruminantium]SHK90930.1 Transposase and inactivated derivatives [Selenomonas ruminantium]